MLPRHRLRSGFADGPTSIMLGSLAFAAWLTAVWRADPARMGAEGLITVLGPAYWIAVICSICAVVIELARSRPRPYALLGLAVLLVFIIFGSAPAIEPIAGNPTSWTHVGFVDYIARNGKVLQGYDARFSWPGMFALAAVVDSITGQHTPLVFLSWAPVGFELSYLPALRLIARASGVSVRAGWIGTFLFYAFNWVDQDYFSPQALNMLFFLVVIGCVLAFWKAPAIPRFDSAGPVGLRVRSWKAQLNKGIGLLRGSRQAAVVLLIVVLMAACVASHQFTPYALVIALASCYVTRRLPGPELPILLAVMAVGWLSLATVNFWEGHLSLLLGGVGSLSSSIGANVSNRIQGSAAHRFIVDVRLVLGATSLGLAGIGAYLRRNQSRTLEFLSITPFSLLVLGSYGGEALLRCFLFSLPFSTLLIGTVLERPFGAVTTKLVATPRAVYRALARKERNWAGCVLVGSLIVVVVALTTLTRGGNDAFESFSSTERAAVTYVYQHAKPGQSV